MDNKIHKRNLITLFWNRLLASDPGLTRLQMASSATIGVGSTLLIEYIFTEYIVHADTNHQMISMLIGALVALIGIRALSGTDIKIKILTAIFFPVALGSGILLAILVHGNPDLTLWMFIFVMFLAVAVRRFGISFYFYGFMLWMGYFFTSFAGATTKMIPILFESIILATFFILLLSITILRTNPGNTLRRTVMAFGLRSRLVAETCMELLLAENKNTQAKLLQQLEKEKNRLTETALMVEGWSAERGSLPPGKSAPALRRFLIDINHLIDRIADTVKTLSQGDEDLKNAAAEVCKKLTKSNYEDVRISVKKMNEILNKNSDKKVSSENITAARLFTTAALEFSDLATRILDYTYSDKPSDDKYIDEFKPVVKLAMGNLMGSAGTARDVPARGKKWNFLSRMDMPMRQAVQVAIAGALAVFIGREISPDRYYWAAIAAFVMFTGTTTRAEMFMKGFKRVLGTFLGLFASVGMVHITAGHTMWSLTVILVCIFCGYYLIRVSYTYLIFFITIVVGQMYTMLHRYSPELLILRLEETLVGALVGFFVALLVVPLSTSDTILAARNNYLKTLGELLKAAADRIKNKNNEDSQNLEALSRTLDDRLRQFSLVAQPVSIPAIKSSWRHSPRIRHRLALYAAITTDARALAVALRNPCHCANKELAGAFQSLATAVNQLADVAPGQSKPSADKPLNDAEYYLNNAISETCEDDTTSPIMRPLLHLKQLIDEVNSPQNKK